MPRTYRPFLVAKRGETTALSGLASWSQFEPVLRVPSREKDWQSGGFMKSLEAHVDAVIERIVAAAGSHPVFVDIAPLGTESPVHGVHPMAWILEEASRLGVPVKPLVRSTSSSAVLAAARAHHAATQAGVGVYVGVEDWETGANASGRSLIASVGILDGDIDVFADAGPAPTTATPGDIDQEVDALVAGHTFRSVSVGSAGFVSTRALPRGISLHDRVDFTTWQSTYGIRAGLAKTPIDFFDYGIENPWFAPEEVNPAFLSISALLRYTAGTAWVLTKGVDLYKGPGGSSRGGAALIPALTALAHHPLYKDVVVTDADAWIDDVVAGSSGVTPGNPEAWRRWGTLRHVSVTVSQVSSLA
ncbi:hypothetical protein QUG98_04465 [Curtobacterium sp. RHCJP20]|uniref:Uncharacterized protein n=1 Tax=Curtobacterium subtropicum TaxID=3055138 RepID=A0ABT7TFL3_9MICO|nr:hypothetical protein [Curtobacterium subtropicum]MDM7887702.1 hypothetical protein [Curtobacterium subtropicum]